MVFFHVSFLLLGLLAVFLMVATVVAFDWSAFGIIIIAVSLNAFFLFLWIREDRKKPIPEPLEPQLQTAISHVFSMVSLVVPVRNEEVNLASHIASLIKCSSGYRGPIEIIIVDDGSTDNTFEVAWSTIDSKQSELLNIRIAVVRHMARLGKTEAIKSGVNKAMGEYIATIDTAVSCDSVLLNKLVDSTYAAKEASVNLLPHLETEGITTVPSTIRLYRASVLRRLINEGLPKTAKKVEIELRTPKKK